MINLLNILMIFNFIIGILLLIISFYIYSELTENCSSEDIRDKLKISIIIASVLISISVGYGLCVKRNACDCNFGKTSNAKINTILLFLIALGSTLLWLNYGIKNDLNKPGCNISVGSLPDILIVICFVQVIVPGLYLIALITKLYDDSDGKSDKSGEDEEGEEDEEDEEDEKGRVELKENLRKRERLIKKDLSKTRTELSKSREKVEALKRKKKKPSSDLVAKIIKLQKTESSIKDSLQSIRSELSEADDSSSDIGSDIGSGISSV